MEDAAIYYLTLDDCEKVDGAKELFDFKNIELLKKKMKKFFCDIMRTNPVP